jgi:hypothetical protein
VSETSPELVKSTINGYIGHVHMYTKCEILRKVEFRIFRMKRYRFSLDEIIEMEFKNVGFESDNGIKMTYFVTFKA